MKQGETVVVCQAHNLDVVGSSPTPANRGNGAHPINRKAAATPEAIRLQTDRHIINYRIIRDAVDYKMGKYIDIYW